MAKPGYSLSRLANGAYAVHSLLYGERMHPGLGPAAEAELLYVGQLRIPERLAQHQGEFVVWDIGLGAAANAIAVLRATRESPCPLRLVSFDDTLEPLRFALRHAGALSYLHGYEAPIKAILGRREVKFTEGEHDVTWESCLGDFPSLVVRGSRGGEARIEAYPSADETRENEPPYVGPYGKVSPHAIMFDPFSPAKNPGMWTLPLFTNLFGLLDPARPCNLTTYSRSTMLRVTLLLAGFFVGRGVPTGLKEETTVAANTLELIEKPLDIRWLERARRSDSAEPLREAIYRRVPLESATWNELQRHSQFAD